MKHIETTNQAITNAGGLSVLANSLSEQTGLDRNKMYERIKKWQYNGVSRDFIKPLAKFGKVAVTKLIPDIY